MADKGLCPACGNTGLIEADNGDKTRCEDCYEKRIIKTAKLQTLADVWKAMSNECKGWTKGHSESFCNISSLSQCTKENCPLIKNLREAL